MREHRRERRERCPYCHAEKIKPGHVVACALSTSVRPPFPPDTRPVGRMVERDQEPEPEFPVQTDHAGTTEEVE